MRTRFAISAAVLASLTVGLAAAAALPGPVARVDQVFHTARFPLHPVGSEPLRSGFVENAHANGPTIIVHEQYVLNGAQPATAYQVTLNIFVRDTTSASSAGVVFPTAIITTDAAGNGSGDAVFLPSGVPPCCATPPMASSIRSPIRRVSSTAAGAWWSPSANARHQPANGVSI